MLPRPEVWRLCSHDRCSSRGTRSLHGGAVRRPVCPLIRDQERDPVASEAMIHVAMGALLAKHIACPSPFSNGLFAFPLRTSAG
jgi:hypothetical protein